MLHCVVQKCQSVVGELVMRRGKLIYRCRMCGHSQPFKYLPAKERPPTPLLHRRAILCCEGAFVTTTQWSKDDTIIDAMARAKNAACARALKPLLFVMHPECIDAYTLQRWRDDAFLWGVATKRPENAELKCFGIKLEVNGEGAGPHAFVLHTSR